MTPAPQSSFDPDFATAAQWAVMYRERGVQVIPCYYPHESTNWKRPKLSEWVTLQEALVPEVSFQRWYGPGGEYAARDNMGLISGRASGNIFVVDLDTHKHPEAALWWSGLLALHNYGDEPETWRQTTGGGGRQILFKARPDWHAPTNKTSIGVDIRGQGGFAVMPSSKHDSGRRYTWDEGGEPWLVEIEDAPEWLLEAIEVLVDAHGGDKGTGPRLPNERRAYTGPTLDAFGNMVDGREAYMAKVVWAAVLDLRRDAPIRPSEAEQEAACAEAYQNYERAVKSRLGGATTAEALDREGRGPQEFGRKWRAAMRQWDGKVAEQAKEMPEKVPYSNSYSNTPPPNDEEAIHQAEERAKASDDGLFEFLDVAAIKAMRDPEWLVEGLIPEKSLGFIFGPPGCLKTFMALSLGLSFAVGMDEWWGRKVQRQGAVIYISSEGQSDLKFRLQAWEQKNQVLADPAPFYLIRQTINFMKADDVGKLLATVQRIKEMCDVPIAAVFVDTVSRVLPGADENLQKDMTLFVSACDAVRERFEATVIGVHHTNAGGQMRGSTVFPGAGDFIVEVKREQGETFGHIKAAKIKAAPDGWEQHFKVETITLSDIAGNTSLVLNHDENPAPQKPKEGWPDTEKCRQILGYIDSYWHKGEPLSSFPNTKHTGRFAARKINSEFGISAKLAIEMIETWLTNEVIKVEMYDRHTKVQGLKVVGRI